MAAEPSLAFVVDTHEPPALEVRVNFGMFAGRDVTNAEIDRLARRLADLGEFAIVAERRHDFAGGVEAAVHQVRIEVADSGADAAPIVAAAQAWAADCIADRHAEVSEL